MAESPSNAQHILILLGPPGSGKGTQAKRITQELHIPHISTGDILRDNIQKKSDLGTQAEDYMSAGRLVPDPLVLGMLFERVAQDDCEKGYLLDGFPRTIPQAESLDAFLSQDVHLLVVNLSVSDEVLIKRIAGRLSCASCGSVYNRYFSQPKVDEECDKCAGKLKQRPDDQLEVVLERIKIYERETAPLIEYYQKKGILHSVNGEQDPIEISHQVLALIAG